MDNTQSPIMLRKESLGSTVNGPQSSDKSVARRKARFAGKEPLGEETLIAEGLKEYFK